MNELLRLLRDPRISTSLILGATVFVGLAVVLVGGQRADGLQFVTYQTPYLVSGGFAGIAITGTALGLLMVHLDRVEAARERRALQTMQRDALRLLSVVAERRSP